jgi:hypothetical protein
MTYVALLYSPHLDQFETDCANCLYTSYDIAEWVGAVCEHYNRYFNVDDFHIISINKIGE